MVASGLLLLTERELDRSRDAVSSADYRDAIAAAEDAVDLMPWSAEPRIQLGLAYQRAGDYASAREAIREGIDRADEDWRWWRSLALVDGISGDIDAACRDVERARELNPRQLLLYERVEGLDCPGPDPEPPPPEN
jgi:Tfp pilus assembly protein PilF